MWLDNRSTPIIRPMPSSVRTLQPVATLPSPRVALVVSRYNRWITDALEQGAVEEFARRSEGTGELTVLPAPGSFELPVLARAAASSGRFAAVVCLGCIIKGETSHDQHIARAVVSGLEALARDSGVPIGLGVLTVDDSEQAEARAGGTLGNKGAEAMAAAMECAGVILALASPN